MSIFFDQVDVAINQSGIIATNASVESNNSVEAAFVIGYYHPINQLPFGSIKTTFKCDYIPESNYEPNFGIVNKLKNLIPDTGYKGEKVEIAGITHDYCFLDSYSLKIQPNNIIQANVQYTTYFPPCGNIKLKNNRINYLNDGSVINGWTTYILQTGDYNNIPVFDLNYDFKASWQPIYVIGKKYPVSIKLLNMSESLNFNIDQYRNILITGENIFNNIFASSDSNIKLKNLSMVCQDSCFSTGDINSSLNIDIDGFKINNINVIGLIGEYVRTNYQTNKYI